MQTNLLEFLFGENVVRERDLGEELVRLFEEAEKIEKIEGVELVTNKKPLADALKALGIDATVENKAQWCEIHCDNDAEYHDYTRRLVDAEAMHKLAEMGWVMVKCGDTGMANEKPNYVLGFIEIDTPEGGDSDKVPDAEKIRKDAWKAGDATEFKRDDKLNPVELSNPKMGEKQTGISNTKEGDAPEGKPKGSTKKTESVNDLLPNPDALNEVTTTGAVPAFPSGGAPMSLMSQERRRRGGRFLGRRRQPPPPKPYGVSPANS
jgi:hypothetical protein